ncbi:hypothetical protein ABK040_008878 [Willaertia magna]
MSQRDSKKDTTDYFYENREKEEDIHLPHAEQPLDAESVRMAKRKAEAAKELERSKQQGVPLGMEATAVDPNKDIPAYRIALRDLGYFCLHFVYLFLNLTSLAYIKAWEVVHDKKLDIEKQEESRKSSLNNAYQKMMSEFYFHPKVPSVEEETTELDMKKHRFVLPAALKKEQPLNK